MADTMVWAGQPSVEEPEPGTAQPKRRGGWAGPIALIAGLLGMVFAVAVPLLPVRVDAATLSWPQAGSARSIEAPLISYAPLTFDATLPCTAINQLSAKGGTLAATGPTGAPDLERYGFVARVTAPGADAAARLDVVLRNQALLSVPVAELVPGCELTVHADNTKATATLVGFEAPGFPVLLNGDYRPQMVGIFSDLAAADGAKVTAELDTRFSSTPTPIKRAAIWLAVLCTIVALVALYRLDRQDGRRVRRFLPQRWWTFSLLDGAVLGTMLVWYFIGSTTSDDGYQFGMARASGVAGYMANYFAYFGVPENPVGTPYYDLIRIMTEISTASPWVRLPALLCGVLMWLLLSREVAPRLGVAVRHNGVAMWTGALGFLTIWLAYDNGLRPEPPVALGLLLTWCLVERAIATRRLLPAGFAILVAAFACTAGPSGVICIAALLAGLRPVARIIMARIGTQGSVRERIVGYAMLLAPLLAAGTVALSIMFADQPLTAMFEMKRIHHIVGPDVEWFNDYLRYQYLFQGETDGSVGRRIGVLAMLAGIVVCVLVLLRKGGRIPLTAAGPTRRILGVTVGALLLIMTTPTKWTHHFGVYAGVAGAVAMVTAMAVAPRVLRAPRYRAVFAAMVAFLLALVFSGPNKWWYVSSYGIPWWDKTPVVAGFELNKLFLSATVVLLAVAAWWHVHSPEPGTPHRVSRFAWRVSVLPPLTIALALLVVWDVGSFAKAAVSQGPAFSLARSNIEALTGKTAGLAGHVLVETDPNAGMLAPLTGDAVSTLSGVGTGFTGAGVAGDLRPDDSSSPTGSIADALSSKSSSENTAGTATDALPFGLNPATTPVLGSYGSGDAGPADLTTGWYRLPENADRTGIIALTAAGRIRSVDADGIVTPGQTLEIEYGASDSATTAQPMGRVTPIDIGPAPSWRNLRVPFTEIPSGADVIRIVAVDRDRNPKQWLALTPPRVPRTQTLDAVVGSRVPVLTDWMVGLQFPKQRPYDHRDNIAEIPAYRILPDRPGAEITSLWQSRDGGGPLGWSNMLLRPRTLATYLDQDWRRDWGELQQLTRIDATAAPAAPTITRQDHSGLWTPGHINTSY
ncbi:arabinosyltransferase domain-containing protein [Nocardia sp. NBC_00565]|uniref:arabinosyltransferase domain-containing protein n=1 Tax=Nocardia sp. NBC_00565 TaxID=2975993 RepID=UPI002E811C19|nr:arabinosyltransferase domain-containing protein [Nocardia sp. NBC_00565]WUC04406.1 arabinosyltransferase domain-containing protein [Nocardia sp. NBC_00565]